MEYIYIFILLVGMDVFVDRGFGFFLDTGWMNWTGLDWVGSGYDF